MKLWIYTLCFNEEKILPFFLRHYEALADRIIVYDNNSTDGSSSIIDAHRLCERRVWFSGNEIRDDLYLEIKNHAWKEIQEQDLDVDWVAVVDMDEFLWADDLPERLAWAMKHRGAVIQCRGWEMFSPSFDFSYSGSILDRVTRGIDSQWYYKKAIFQPRYTREIGYGLGAHEASQVLDRGYWVLGARESGIQLLHFKHIDISYTTDKLRRSGERLSLENRLQGCALAYLKDPLIQWNHLRDLAESSLGAEVLSQWARDPDPVYRI